MFIKTLISKEQYLQQALRLGATQVAKFEETFFSPHHLAIGPNHVPTEDDH